MSNIKTSDLLQPLGVETFAQQYLAKRAVYMPGDASRLEGLLTRERFFHLIDNPKADVFIGNVDPEGRFHQFIIPNKRASSMLACGFSLQVEELHLLDSRLMEVANRLREDLGLYPAMEAAALLSPPSKGYPIHMDPNPDVWILQISGEKRWRFSRKPATPWPLSWAMATPTAAWGGDPWEALEKPGDHDFEEAMMTPGDILYFPGGTWHTTEATEESLSVILANVNSTWVDFFFEELREKLLPNPAWRYIPPTANSSMLDVLQKRYEEMTEVVGALDPKELIQKLESRRLLRRKGAYRQSEK